MQAFSFEEVDELGFCPYCRQIVTLHSFTDAGHRSVYVDRHDGHRECSDCVFGPAMLTLGPLEEDGAHAWISWTLRDCGIVIAPSTV